MKSLKEYIVKEDSVDIEKHDKLNDIFMALEKLSDEVYELEALDAQQDSSGVGDLNDQLVTFRKMITGLYQVIDRSSKVVPMESVDEAVGDFAKPIYDLIDDLGDTDQTHANVLHDLIRYLDGDTIKDFVEEFRRVHDYGDGMEYESVQKDQSQDLDNLKKLAGI